MPDLTKAQQERARREMVRQKQQAAQEKKDIRMNEMRSENIMRRKRAAEKMGKTFSYKDITTPSAEGGPLNYGSPMKKSSCIKMYDKKGKQTGLMMEGSVAHMESMSPNKMDHGSMANYGSPAMQTDPNKDKKDKKDKTHLGFYIKSFLCFFNFSVSLAASKKLSELSMVYSHSIPTL